MSNLTYNEDWRDVMAELAVRLESEVNAEPLLQDLAQIYRHYGHLYVFYVKAFKKLEDCYDQIVQPQKRSDVRVVLEATMGRLLEIKELLVSIAQTNFINLDDVMTELQITPDALEIPCPRYFLEERSKELEQREKLLNALIVQYSIKKEETTETADANQMTLEEAIRILQNNERGRQGRQRAKEAKEYRQHERDPNRVKNTKPTITQLRAAVLIQKAFRGHLARKRTKERRYDEMSFIGMQHKERTKEDNPIEKAELTRTRRKLIQHGNEQEYQKDLVLIKQKLVEQEGPELREKIQDEVRTWFIQHKEQTGKFPTFPTAEEGGSSVLKDWKPEDSIIDEAPTSRTATKKSAKAPVKSSTSAPARRGNKKEEEKLPPIEIPKSKFFPTLNSGLSNYQNTWKDRNETNNFAQKHDPELIKQALRPDVEKEVRVAVDEILRVELANLKMAVEGKKKKGGKPAKKKSKKKGKKNKDPTADRSIESLYGELVSKQIIQKSPNVPLQKFLGSFNYVTKVVKDGITQSVPSLGEVRRVIYPQVSLLTDKVVNEYCILPLVSENVHKCLPIKTILFFGCSGSGKTMLTHAVASQTGSVFFDLSPSHFTDKDPLLDAKMLMHMVFKVAKTMAPAVIYIDEIENIFRKQKKKKKDGEEEDTGSPMKKYKKLLFSHIKQLQPGERVLIIGNSSNPASGGKLLTAFFNKMIYIPPPDYASRQILWSQLIAQEGGKLKSDTDVPSLAKISEGYSAGSVTKYKFQFLTPKIAAVIRDTIYSSKVQLEKKLFDAHDCLTALAKAPKAENEALEKFAEEKVTIKKIVKMNADPNAKDKKRGSTAPARTKSVDKKKS